MLRKRTGKKLIRIQTAIMAVFLVCLNIVVPVSECYAYGLSEQIIPAEEQQNIEQAVVELTDVWQSEIEQSELKPDDITQDETEQNDILQDGTTEDEIEQIATEQTDEVSAEEVFADVDADEVVNDEVATYEITEEADESLVDDFDEEIYAETYQEIIPEMLAGQDNDELFEEYVNEIMFQQMGATDILQQSDIADSVSDDTGNGSLNFREVVAMYAAPAMAANGFNLTELQSILVDTFNTFAGRVANGEIGDTNLVIAFVAPENEDDYKDTNYVLVDYPDNMFYFDEMGVAGAEDGKKKIMNDYITFQKVFDAATYNNPYLFYWSDKTGGTSMSVKYGVFSDRMRIREITVHFSVTPDYSSGNPDSYGRYYKTNLKKTAATKKAVLEAKRVVAENATLSDYYKLCAYRDYIYSAVSYDYSALSADSYGGPWQLIYVFDKDASTNVVCEGYAKAFKYLCDLTDFDDNIFCALMGGYMSSGGTSAGHMWNILTMPDGKHYMVDLTNSDNGNTGSGYLFLKGYIGTGTDTNVPASCQNSYYRYVSRYSNLKYYAFKKFEEYYAGTDIMQLSQTDYVDNHMHQYVDGYCAKCNSYLTSDIALEGCSLKVGNTATLSVYISDAGEWKTNADNYLKLIYINGTDEIIKVSEAVSAQKNGKDMYVFDIKFDMRQLADTVKMYFYDAAGNVYHRDKGPEQGKLITYTVSVKEYVTRLMSTECAEGVKDCLQTILLYGGSVQKYTNYNTANLASRGVTVAGAHLKKISDRDMESLANKSPVAIQYFGSGKPVSYKSISMSFADKTVMKVYLSFAQNADGFSFYVDGNETAINRDIKGYYVAVDNIMPTSFSQASTVEVKSMSGGNSVLEVKVSPYNWVGMLLEGNNSSNVALMATAKYVYYLGRYGKNE